MKNLCVICWKEFSGHRANKWCSIACRNYSKAIKKFQRKLRQRHDLNRRINGLLGRLAKIDKFIIENKPIRPSRDREAIEAKKRQLYKKRNRYIKSRMRKINKKHIANLEDSYIAATIGIKKRNCPPELIAAKRAQLQLKRFIKKQQTNTP